MDGSSGIKKTTDGHGLHLGIPWPYLVQVETGSLMLPYRRWKRKGNVTLCSWYTKSGTLHIEINLLLTVVSFVYGAKGYGSTPPSCASRNGSIDASRSLLEAQLERYLM